MLLEENITKLKKQHRVDNLFRYITMFAALAVIIIFIGIIYQLFRGSLPSLNTFGFNFLWSSDWNPVTQKFGALIAITGTLITSIIALMIGIPISFGIAVCLTEIVPCWLRQPLRIAVELLAG